MEQLNKLWFKCFSNRVVSVTSVKKFCKICEKKDKGLCAESYYFYYLFWPGVCLKLEAAHKFIESRK